VERAAAPKNVLLCGGGTYPSRAELGSQSTPVWVLLRRKYAGGVPSTQSGEQQGKKRRSVKTVRLLLFFHPFMPSTHEFPCLDGSRA